MKKLIEDLIKDAMRQKDTLTRDTLRVLRGEIERNENTEKGGKVALTDMEIKMIAKKMYDNVKALEPDSPELPIIEQFIPKKLTDNELETELNKVLETNKIDSPKGVGIIMKYFKENFEGRYDGKVLTDMIKTKF